MVEKIDLLQTWADHASAFKWLHDRSHKQLSKKNFSLSIPLLFLNTVSGMLVYSTDRFKDNQTYLLVFETIVGSINILCVILAGIKDYAKYGEKAELHTQSFKQWAKFKNEIYVELAAPTGHLDTFLFQMKTKYSDLLATSPIIPNDIIESYLTEMGDNIDSMMLPDIVDGKAKHRLTSGCSIDLDNIV